MRKHLYFILLNFLVTQLTFAQTPEVLAIRKYVDKNAGNIINEFATFLSLPNVAANPAGQQKNAVFIIEMMNKRGIQKIQLLNASSPGVPPVVYGEVIVPGAKQTLVFYAHYDGQPVNPAQWAKDLDPFDAKLFSDAIDKHGANIPFPPDGIYSKEWRIYARSASDDKAGVDAILNGYGALRKTI